jgi:hypothetical protein
MFPTEDPGPFCEAILEPGAGVRGLTVSGLAVRGDILQA